MCAEHEACHEAAWQAQSLRVQTSARLLGLWVAQALLVPAMPPAAEVHSRSECRAAECILQLNNNRIGDAIG
jgi:hypothetical protein